MFKLVILILALVLYVPVIFYGGYVLSDLWSWFVLPTFTSMPTLTASSGAGLIFVSNFLIGPSALINSLIYVKLQTAFPESSDDGFALITVITLAITFTTAWIMGAIIHSFM